MSLRIRCAAAIAMTMAIQTGSTALAPACATECIRFNDYPHLVWTGSIPGTAFETDIELDGDQLYVGMSFTGVSTWDVSDRRNPVQTGTLDTWRACGLARSGDALFVADGDSGLIVLDLDDPRQPRQVARQRLPGKASSVACSRAYAYVSGSDVGLHVVDVLTPSHPVHLRTVAVPETLHEVTVAGDYLYLCVEDLGVQVYSLALPDDPRYLVTIPAPQKARSFAVRGQRGYLGTGYLNAGAVTVCDLSDPTAPEVIATLATGGVVTDIKYDDDYLYVAAGLRGLRILRLGDQEIPAMVGWLDVSGVTGALAVEGTYAFRANEHGGLEVVDLGNRESPPFLGALSVASYVDVVEIDAGMAFFAGSDLVLRIADVADPARMSELGALGGWGKVTGLDRLGDLLAVGDQRYDDCCAYGSWHLVDISDPAHPARLSSRTMPGEAFDVALYRQSAIVADGSGGLSVYDISQPANPQLTARLPLGYVTLAHVSGDFLYLGVDGRLEVHVLAVNGIPYRLGTVQLSEPRAVAVDGSLAYVADSALGLVTVDVTVPNAPTVMDINVFDRRLFDVAVADGHLYAAGLYGFLAFDLADPIRPAYVGQFHQFTGASAIAMSGGVPVAAILGSGLVALPPECTGISAAFGEGGADSRDLLTVGECSPNPFNPQMSFTVTIAAALRVQADIFDLRGGHIANLISRTLETGEHCLAWEGRDDAGRAAPAGVYLLKVSAGGRVASRKALLLR